MTIGVLDKYARSGNTALKFGHLVSYTNYLYNASTHNISRLIYPWTLEEEHNEGIIFMIYKVLTFCIISEICKIGKYLLFFRSFSF